MDCRGKWAFMCPSCGVWRQREIRTLHIIKTTLKCFHCGKSTKINSSTHYGLRVQYKSPDEAYDIKKLNKRR